MHLDGDVAPSFRFFMWSMCCILYSGSDGPVLEVHAVCCQGSSSFPGQV